MANLFSMPSPDEVRTSARSKLFEGKTGAGSLGTAIGLGVGKLFGGEMAGVGKAQKIQEIQQQAMQQFGRQPKTISDIRDFGEMFSASLVGAGFTDEGMQVAKSLQEKTGDKAIQAQTNVLRKDVTNVTKNIRAIEESVDKMEAAAKSNTVQGDQALIFTWMKTLDPTSTVREGEYATAKDSTLIPAWAMDLYNKSVDQTLLLPTERQKFLDAAQGQKQASRAAADRQIGNILQLADQDNIPREKVLGTERLQKMTKRQYDERKKALGL